jgi:hypothetical protein
VTTQFERFGEDRAHENGSLQRHMSNGEERRRWLAPVVASNGRQVRKARGTRVEDLAAVVRLEVAGDGLSV